MGCAMDHVLCRAVVLGAIIHHDGCTGVLDLLASDEALSGLQGKEGQCTGAERVS
jgi:hypothetical protein